MSNNSIGNNSNMASTMRALHESLAQSDGNVLEERVEVNQRHLIDKILAR